MARPRFTIPREMPTVCRTITVWILQPPWKGRNIKNGKAAGFSPCIMCMAGKMHMPLPSAIIRMIRRKHRPCKLLCSAGFLRLLTILNSEDENRYTISFLFFYDAAGFLHQSDQCESEQCSSGYCDRGKCQ